MSTPTSQPTPGGPVDPDLEPGQLVGEYEVSGKLGHGAFGTVFRAAHPLIGKVVAIKVLGRKFSVDPEMVSRFIAEARAVNQIRHRHIIDIFSFGQLPDGRHYYVMELLEGETLDARLERGPLALPEAIGILRGIARALDAAHAKGIAHRDLKAENVFLAVEDGAGEPWPKLLDFGIAKLMAPEDGLKHKTRTGSPIGTPYYMSPEQCRGRDVDHRTDLYAFGVLAYLMLTGAYPFDGDDYMSILMKQISEPPPAPSSVVPELPEGVDEVVLALMQKDPADRPVDLRTAMQGLERAAGVTAPQTGPVAAQTPSGGHAAVSEELVAAVASTTLVGEASVRGRRAAKVAIGGAVLAAVIAAVVIVVVKHGDGAPTGQGSAEVPPRKTTAPLSTPALAPAPPPAPTPTPASVIITVDGPPDGTDVLVSGASVGAAPGPVQLPRGDAAVVLTFKADGYLPIARSVVPDHDQGLTVMLKKKLAPRAAGRPGKDDLADPFAGSAR